MADAPPKTNIRDRGVLANLLDFNKMRDDSAEVGNAFFNKSTEHNGPADAMRHVIFNAKLTTGTGSRFIPWLLDKLHEYGETAAGQPRAEMEMDLANGELGREIGKLGLSDAEMVDLAQRAVQGGKAVYMTKPPQKTDYATGGEVDTEPTDLEQAVQEQFGLEPNLDRATLLPYKSKDKGWIAPEALYQAAKLVASPITALHGKYISPEEAVEGALTLGSPSTAAGLVSKAEPGMARMFIGNRSNAWDDKAHALALKMEDEGASPRTIWEQTMNWRTPEGRWVQEVSDKGASYDPAQALQNANLQYKQELQKVKNYTQPYQDALRVNELFKGLLDTTPNPFHEVYAEPHPRAGEVIYHPSTGMPMVKAGAEQQVEEFKQALKQQAMQQFEQESGAPLSKEAETHFRTTPAWQLKTAASRTPASFGVTRPSAKSMQGLTMERALEAPETYAAYPGLRRYPFEVKPESKMGGANASFQPTNGLVSLSAAAEEPTASLLHELQHAVQHREGLEGGANPQQFEGLRSDVAHQLYLRNLGEGMARATAARKDLTMAQRNAIFPAESFSLPNVSPSTTMEQFMWEGMDPAKKSLILKYINNNIDDLTWKARMTGKDVDIPLAYDPDKVGSIADSLHAEMAEKPTTVSALPSDYQGGHKPSGRDFGAPLHDLTTLYPDDVYGPNAVRFYGTGDTKMDTQSMRKAQSFRNKPDATVDIYRAVPNDSTITDINHADWVTINKDYAKLHGESALRGDYKILSQKVKAKDLFTPADSIHEWGYFPEEEPLKKAEGGEVIPPPVHKRLAAIASMNIPLTDTKLQHAMEQPAAENNVVGYAEGGRVSKHLAHISGVKSELPGVIREIATAAQLQHQPLAVSGLLAPADETPFGEMPALSAQELAARGTATVPSVGMSNVGLRGANVGRTVPYYAGKGLQAEGWEITPEMVKEYQKAGINKLVTGKGGNYEVVVGHEGSHDTFPSEEENRRFTYERYAGSPEGAIAEAQYRVTDPHNPAFIEAVKAAYPRIGNPKYGEVSRTLEEYKKAQPVNKEVTIGLVAQPSSIEYDPSKVQSIVDQLRQEIHA